MVSHFLMFCGCSVLGCANRQQQQQADQHWDKMSSVVASGFAKSTNNLKCTNLAL